MDAGARAGSPPALGPGRSAYIVGILILVYTLNVADRSVIAIIQEPLRAEFGWKDWQLGLLGGAAFGLLYSVLGLPIARIAERSSRVNIIALSAGIWSTMTCFCGLATSLPGMLLARIGVGIGEAGCTPPAHSLISSYFSAKRRATVLSLYSVGMTLGPMVAALGGGWVLVNYGWREVFLALGTTGVVMAAIVKLTVKEPLRSGVEQVDAPGFRDAMKALLAKPTYVHVVLGSAAGNFINAGITQFIASFFVRTHQLPLQQATFIFGVVQGLFATAAILVSGLLADHLNPRFPRASLWIAVAGLLACIPFYAAAFTTHIVALSFTALMAAKLGQWLYISPLYAVVQGVAHPRGRATATAVNLLASNFVGYVFGPPAIGALSDLMATRYAESHGLDLADCAAAGRAATAACATATAHGLQAALVVFVCLFIWPAIHFMRAARTLEKDMVG